jgi:Tfp pilus assembly protein PilO
MADANPRTTALLAILLAGVVGYIAYTGEVLQLIGVPGLQQRTARVEALQDTVRTLEASVDSARRELARGSVEDVRQRADQHRATLAVLRQLVPEQNEVPDLLDDISTRAKIRGVNLAAWAPEAVQPGPAPFDTYSYQMSVVGRYDQIGQFLTDVAGLRRIFVPLDVSMASVDQTRARALGDTTSAMLEAKFKVRTFVRAAGGIDGQ